MLMLKGVDGYIRVNPNVYNLQNIITSQAIMSTLSYRLNMEVLNENLLINEVTRIKCHPEEIIYVSILIYILYSNIDYTNYIENKLQNIKMFSIIKQKSNSIIFILLMIFTRNIENAI
jgi:hypothetical protein